MSIRGQERPQRVARRGALSDNQRELVRALLPSANQQTASVSGTFSRTSARG
jgi:hypothetical protein